MSLTQIIAGIALFAGVGLGIVAARRSPDTLALALAGLLAGVVIGLSASPVIGAAIAALVSLAGAVVPVLLAKPETRSAPSIAWMAPVAAFALLGVLAGITLRANDLLRFEKTSLRAELAAKGFTAQQTDRIMERWVATIEREDLLQASASSLLSAGQNLRWADLRELPLSRQELVEHIHRIGSNADKAFIADLQAQGADTAQIYEALRKRFTRPVPP